MIKQSAINTFNRVGIDYKALQEHKSKVEVANRFTGERVKTNALIAVCILWVYLTSDSLEAGMSTVTISDFDRVRYFILDQDRNAYNVCID